MTDDTYPVDVSGKTRAVLDNDIDWMLANEGGTIESVYHDSGKCWDLIERLVERLRDALKE